MSADRCEETRHLTANQEIRGVNFTFHMSTYVILSTQQYLKVLYMKARPGHQVWVHTGWYEDKQDVHTMKPSSEIYSFISYTIEIFPLSFQGILWQRYYLGCRK